MGKRKRSSGGQVVGFIVTPGEIENRIAALDKSVQALNRSIVASKAPRLNSKWRAEWDAYLRRWAVERDSYASWDSRLFATRVIPRLEAFEKNYRWWARDYQKRSGDAPAVPAARPSEGLPELVPTGGWILAGVAVAVYFWAKGRKGGL